MTNSLPGLTEVSISQAASSLMGLRSMSTTTNTVVCFIKGAMRYQDTLVTDDSSLVSHDLCDSDEDNLSELENDNLSFHSQDNFQGIDANENEELNED